MLIGFHTDTAGHGCMSTHHSLPRVEAASRATSLLLALLVAKTAGLAGRDLTFTPTLPSVLIWDDVALAFVFWMASRWFIPAPVSALAYWTIVSWCALNVAVVRTLSSPLTVNMLRAAGGALSDSIAMYVTPVNVASVALVLVTAALSQRVRAPARVLSAGAAIALAIALPGPFVEAQSDTGRTHRNALSTLLRSALPRVPAARRPADLPWRASLSARASDPDLGWLRGSARGRNVVIVVLESTGAQYLRSYGASDDPMPTLTALAGHAVQFDTAYAAYPESVKGLFAVLCSRHPAVDVSVLVHAGAACDPLAGVLAAAGYQSALFHSGRFGYLGMDAIVARQQFDVHEDAGAIGGAVESSFGIDEASTVSRMLEWLDARDPARPFLLAYLPIAGHHPYVSPEPLFFQGSGTLVAYKNALRHADDSLSALLGGLRERGLMDETVLVVFGDHGEAFGQHPGNVGHTLFIFEENVRVPLLISAPGLTDGAIRSTRTASVIDVAPSILDVLGLPVPDSYEGLSLLQGPDPLALFVTDYALGWAGLRDGCWKYLLELEGMRPYLFDLCRQPDERSNVAAAHGELERAYRTRVLAWAAATRRSYDTPHAP